MLAAHTMHTSRVAAAARLDVRDLGRIDYADAVRLQDELVEARLRDDIADTLLLLEHPPVITLGRRASLSDVYLSQMELQQRGIALETATRGGLVTYHGPGQLVGYPIVSLRARGLSVPCYVRALEHAVIAALSAVGVDARIEDGNVGVWTDQGKIAAIGVAQRHGITLHGFAVNLQPDLSHFNLINACGIGERGVTSAAAILGHHVDIPDFKARLAQTVNEQLTQMSQSACQPVSGPVPGRQSY
jgi:lipoate-protein ligase B